MRTPAALLAVALLTASGSPLVTPSRSADPPTAKAAPTLTRERASAFAKLALRNMDRPLPHKPGVVWAKADEVKPPKELHPAFFGCFDWHSAVHGHWMLVRVLKLHPDLPEGKKVREALAAHLTADNITAEVAVFARKENKAFERPYGWAWLLKLAAELHTWDDPDARTWAANLKPLADLIAGRYVEYFPKQTHPVRSGVHSNTAFGLTFAHDYAKATGDKKLRVAIEERAKGYYQKDADAPARWEPDGTDFLSPSLCEADLMRRVLTKDEFQTWLTQYLPGLGKGEPATLFTPATVTDRSDGHLVHLDGLNLSRAWCLKGIASSLPADDPRRQVLLDSAAKHAAAGLAHVASGDYAGEHWLASFAVHMLSVE
jgi:hypothetical protein